MCARAGETCSTRRAEHNGVTAVTIGAPYTCERKKTDKQKKDDDEKKKVFFFSLDTHSPIVDAAAAAHYACSAKKERFRSGTRV